MKQLSEERISELCEECGGWCCKYTNDKIEIKEDAPPHYWEAVDYQKVRATKWFEDGEWIRFYYNSPCKHINEETGKCKIYKTRPSVCRKFPAPTHYKSGWKHYCEIVKETNKLNSV
ncbi:MAG: YkgJ family cysteine cluster protein [Candidatus Dadabacteria bacterium]